jgi:sugar lactone lactonase YvrE
MLKIKPLTTSVLFALAVNNGAWADESAQSASTFKPTWTLGEGLAQPESVVYDAKRSRLYVSNLQGCPMTKDGAGYLSSVSLNGQLLEKKWVKGLNAPKGMAIVGNTLYVSDIDSLVAVHISEDKGKVVKRYQAENAQLLNDVTADNDGNVYVSDLLTNTIHCLCKGKFGIWLHDADLMNPNGLLAEENRLVVGSWGIFIKGGFATTTAGHLKAVSYADKKITSLGDAKPVGNIDGVESDGASGYYVTDWMVGKLFHLNVAGKAQEIMQLKQGTADHAYIADQKLLLIPMMMDNQLKAFKK